MEFLARFEKVLIYFWVTEKAIAKAKIIASTSTGQGKCDQMDH